MVCYIVDSPGGTTNTKVNSKKRKKRLFFSIPAAKTGIPLPNWYDFEPWGCEYQTFDTRMSGLPCKLICTMFLLELKLTINEVT